MGTVMLTATEMHQLAAYKWHTEQLQIFHSEICSDFCDEHVCDINVTPASTDLHTILMKK